MVKVEPGGGNVLLHPQDAGAGCPVCRALVARPVPALEGAVRVKTFRVAGAQLAGGLALQAPRALEEPLRLDVEASARVPNDEPVDEIYALDCSCRSPDPLDIGF